MKHNLDRINFVRYEFAPVRGRGLKPGRDRAADLRHPLRPRGGAAESACKPSPRWGVRAAMAAAFATPIAGGSVHHPHCRR